LSALKFQIPFLAFFLGKAPREGKRFVLPNEALPKKRCLELSSPNKCWSFERLKVPDIFFWAKPPNEVVDVYDLSRI